LKKGGKYRFLFIQPFQLPKGGKHADKDHMPEVSKEQLLRMNYLNIRHLLEAVAAIEDDGAEVITFGCSDVFWLQSFLQKRLRETGWKIPVLEGYSCAIVLAKLFVDLGVDAGGLQFPSERPKRWRKKKVF